MDYRENYKRWLTNDSVDENTKSELISISDDDNEIKERFHKDLEFGTGGLRGIIGAGSNRMNIYTVRRATQGLCEDIKKSGQKAIESGVVIAYDSRHKSYDFALESAKVIAANGIKAYLFDELRPTPELSFAVRHLGCARGIVITASHNPKQYNGYKAYGEDGGQLPPKSTDYVISIINKTDIFDDVKVISEDEAKAKGLLKIIGKEIDDAYLENVKKQSINSENIKKLGDSFSVIYSPFHGTGNKPVRRILDMIGVKNVRVVKEQELPDPDFSTVKSPNPEEKAGFSYAIEMAKKESADLIFATDPDADRIGVIVTNSEGEFFTLTGNQVGVLLTEFILRNKKMNGTLSDKGAIIKTIVTTSMVYPIAKDYGVNVHDVLTGFKYIGELIKDFEENDFYNEFLLGFEESYGYLSGTYARDKDAVVAAMLIAEMAADYKLRGMTLYDGLCSLYEKYGYYLEATKSLTFEGIEGADKIKAIMKKFRENPPKEFAGMKVTRVWDVKNSQITDVITGKVSQLNLPSSDVFRYDLENDSWFAVRPSGTEPKIKFYFGVCENSYAKAESKIEDCMEEISKIL
ncbi:MAG: phospho-sugar mutase [Ruminococcaceae bacterium]|nr:phospho-sugar mutase [Oscillospiraceae bacterium]